jgi:hypothetical protein
MSDVTNVSEEQDMTRAPRDNDLQLRLRWPRRSPIGGGWQMGPTLGDMALIADHDAFDTLDNDIEALRRAGIRELQEAVEGLLLDIKAAELDDEAIAAVKKFIQLAQDSMTDLPSAGEAMAIASQIVWPPPIRVRVRPPRSPGQKHSIRGADYRTVGFLSAALGRTPRTITRWQAHGWLPEAPRRLRVVPWRSNRLWTTTEIEVIKLVAEDLQLRDYQKLPARIGRQLGRRCHEELTRLRALEQT